MYDDQAAYFAGLLEFLHSIGEGPLASPPS
jgi:hypothetical protein